MLKIICSKRREKDWIEKDYASPHDFIMQAQQSGEFDSKDTVKLVFLDGMLIYCSLESEYPKSLHDVYAFFGGTWGGINYEYL